MVDTTQSEKTFVCLVKVFGLVLQTVRSHPDYVSRGNNMLGYTFQRGHFGNSEER